MAAAIYNKRTNSKDADSAGTYAGAPDEPEGQILSDLFKTQHFFEIMERNGMNVRDNTTKRLDSRMLDEYSIVVSMAEEPHIPDFLKNAKKVIWWEIENPKVIDQKIAEDTYEKIDALMQKLIGGDDN